MYCSTAPEICSMYNLVGLVTMIVGNLPHHNSQQAEVCDHRFDNNTYPHHPMNESPKACPNMTPVYKEMEDKVMTEVTPTSVGTNSM